MSHTMPIPLTLLGQSGCLMQFPSALVCLDPYLSDSVSELDAPDLVRQTPIRVTPEDLSDLDWLLLTHEHIDHCDPHTVPRIADACPQARFLGPEAVLAQLRAWDIDETRLVRADERWIELAADLRVHPVPAAHPEIERDSEGCLRYVGYVLEHAGERIYHAGDTSLEQAVIDAVAEHAPVNTAFLPVNERNFFRERRGIIGNMSIRDAFGFAEAIGVRHLVPVHWDMFAANEVTPEEIRAVYRRSRWSFGMQLAPAAINLGAVRASIVIRTLNEARHLDALLEAIARQRTEGFAHEVILVDSGSTDGTLEIAERHDCRILHIRREEFSFGRSLNLGCEAAVGDALVMVSGHCVPTDDRWLESLCRPLLDGEAGYTFGRQVGDENSHFSEMRIFEKYFPHRDENDQEPFFTNNANAALSREEWERLRFDEELTGLEDMELAQRLVRSGGRVAYVPHACVYHLHEETWAQVKRRFEREAIALRHIMPQVHLGLGDFARYLVSSIAQDAAAAYRTRLPPHAFRDIVLYRWNQYWGSFLGNHQDRRLSHAEKDKYFYPS
jgi:L-ascorbate metabolism protein UlaG (beta-lactamase superfamily)/GT2 family glycosyltransferase